METKKWGIAQDLCSYCAVLLLLSEYTTLHLTTRPCEHHLPILHPSAGCGGVIENVVVPFFYWWVEGSAVSWFCLHIILFYKIYLFAQNVLNVFCDHGRLITCSYKWFYACYYSRSNTVQNAADVYCCLTTLQRQIKISERRLVCVQTDFHNSSKQFCTEVDNHTNRSLEHEWEYNKKIQDCASTPHSWDWHVFDVNSLSESSVERCVVGFALAGGKTQPWITTSSRVSVSSRSLNTLHRQQPINHPELFIVREINDFWYSELHTIWVLIVKEPPAKPTLRLKEGLAGDVEPWCQQKISLHNKSSWLQKLPLSNLIDNKIIPLILEIIVQFSVWGEEKNNWFVEGGCTKNRGPLGREMTSNKTSFT